MSKRWPNHPGKFCECPLCAELQSRQRILGAHDNGWTAARIAAASGLPLAHVEMVIKTGGPPQTEAA